MKVGDILIRDISAVFEEETVESFIRSCVNHSRTGMPVLDDDMKLVGYISENDIVNAVIPSYFGMLQSASFIPDTNQLKRNLSEIRKDPISKYMNRSLITVKESDTILHASDLLIRHKFMSLCVVDDEKRFVGIINRSQILLGVLQELQEEEKSGKK